MFEIIFATLFILIIRAYFYVYIVDKAIKKRWEVAGICVDIMYNFCLPLVSLCYYSQLFLWLHSGYYIQTMNKRNVVMLVFLAYILWFDLGESDFFVFYGRNFSDLIVGIVKLRCVLGEQFPERFERRGVRFGEIIRGYLEIYKFSIFLRVAAACLFRLGCVSFIYYANIPVELYIPIL